MTICDIYDALVANDRPYKPSTPAERALDIIGAQVKAGQLDGHYFEVFVEARLLEPPGTDAPRNWSSPRRASRLWRLLSSSEGAGLAKSGGCSNAPRIQSTMAVTSTYSDAPLSISTAVPRFW